MSPSQSAARLSRKDLFRKLADERQMTSLMDREILSSGESFVYDKADWVKLWYDIGHAVQSDCGKLLAYRAIMTNGTLLWYVFHADKTRGYHSRCADPFAAMEEATTAWIGRRAVRGNWAEVEHIAADLRRGRKSFNVSIHDAHRSPLCTVGIEGFVSAVGLATVTTIPGRLAAYLMKIEPQLGFVIYEAWRHHVEEAADIPEVARVPA